MYGNAVSYMFVNLLVPSPPSDLIVNLHFVDYKPVVIITWNVSGYMYVWI